jgi:serine/threonine-protein kinase
MAPELHTGGTPGTTTDVYSLGCLLWAALVGSAPYSGTTDYQLVTAHVSAPVPQLAAAGPFEREVNRILRSAMAKHPSERYPSAAALRDDLRRVLRTIHAPTSVEPATGAEPASYTPYTPDVPSPEHPPSSSSRAGLAAALAVGLVLLVGAGVVGSVLALSGGDDDGGGSAASGATTPGPTNEDGLTRDERVAADNIAAALDANSDFDQIDAECTARKLVQRSGIDGLQEQGLLDENLDFVDSGGIVGGLDPQVYADIITVGVSCVFESVSFGVTPS